MSSHHFFESFLQEGLILQYHDKLFIAEGPFEVLSKPHPSEISFYCPDFFTQKEEFIANRTMVISILQEELLRFLTSYQEQCPPPSWMDPDFNEFKVQFDDFKLSKNIIKAVPVAFARSSYALSSKKRAFLLKNILEKNIGFCYGYWNSRQGVLGVTPEYLFEKKEKYIKTMALAGTGRVTDSLMSDAKEVQEHQIVVEDLLCQLYGVQLKKSVMYEKVFAGLKHLQTDIHFQSDMSFLSLVHKLHPTSALGGSPKENALKWLLKYNRIIDRKRFGAPFGVHFPGGDGFVLTAIRNIQWDKNTMILGSGCGLTEKSRLEKEWMELKLKREWVIRQLWKME